MNELPLEQRPDWSDRLLRMAAETKLLCEVFKSDSGASVTLALIREAERARERTAYAQAVKQELDEALEAYESLKAKYAQMRSASGLDKCDEGLHDWWSWGSCRRCGVMGE